MFRVLASSEALSKGVSLWVLPPPYQYPFSKKIDTYLQFVFRKLPQDKQSQNLLCESSLHLPCQHTLFLPYSSSNQWVQQVLENWKNLQKPSLRIFLPQNMNQKELINHWPLFHLPYKIQILLSSL